MRRRPAALIVALMTASCGDDAGGRTPTDRSPGVGTSVRDDASLFRLITETDSLSGYALFPNVAEFTEGRLNGSEAHRPIVRVILNAVAVGALQNGRLPTNSQFPTGSVIVKEVRTRADATVTTYAVMYKDAGNTRAGNGWLWAEFAPSGAAGYSVSNRGAGCTSCHQRELGPRNDLVRTFERQR